MRKFINLFLIILTLCCTNVFSKITTCDFTNYTVENQGILPNTNNFPRNSYNNVIGKNAYTEGYIIIFGLNIVSDSGQRLTGIRIEHWGIEGFPFILFDSAVITDRNGRILGVLGSSTGILGGVISIPGGVAIPKDDTGVNAGNDFFIGVRTMDNVIDGAVSFIRIPANSVYCNPSEGSNDTLNKQIDTNRIVCELLVGDIMPIEFQPPHPPEDPDQYLKYPIYYQYQPGEMIRPRYDTNTYDKTPYPYKRYVPQVIPYNVDTGVIGIACAQRNVVLHGEATPWMDNANVAIEEKLTSITLTITDIGGIDFDPSKSFYNPITKKPTITLWKDINNNGKWEPGIDYKFDKEITYSSFRKVSSNEWEIDILPKDGYIDRIDTIREGAFSSKSLYDYFIVVNLYPNPEDSTYRPKIGQDFKIWIKRGGIIFGPIGIPVRYAGIDIGETKTLYANLYLEDVSQRRIDGIKTNDPYDKTYNVIPVVGINIAVGPDYQNTRIKKIKVEILSFENFDPNQALSPLSNNEYSGITLWRDNKQKGDIGSFDIEDTFIPANFTGWNDEGIVYIPGYGNCHKYSTELSTSASAIDQGNIYPFDWAPEYQGGGIQAFNPLYKGSDFFLCIRTTEKIKYNSKFRVRIPEEGITLTTPLEGRYNTIPITTEEIYGNVYTEIIPLTDPGNPNLGPESEPVPIFKVILNDNSSGKFPMIEGIAVEFYDRGNFTLDDLAPFSYISPQFNQSTGWYDVTNFDTEELKKCGVVIYKSYNNGNIDKNSPVKIKRYRILSYSGYPSAYQFEFSQPISIPTTLYVVIRTSSSFTKGDSFDAGIVGWGRTQSDWETWGSRAIAIIDKNGLKTNVYARKQSGTIFNPEVTGTIILSINSEYDYIKLSWINQTGKASSFDYYEVIRNDGKVFNIRGPFEMNEWFDRRIDPNGPKEGIQYLYTLRMYYLQAGQQKYVDSNTVPDPLDPYFSHKGKILGFPDDKAPSDVRAVPGIYTITLYWKDNSYDKNYPEKRATRFLIRRTKLQDNTYFETIVYAYPEGQQEFEDYVYYDSGIQPYIKYKYEVYAQRMGDFGIVESKPGISNIVSAYGEQPELSDDKGGGGGCFIATVCFGSPLAKQIQILREFRDKYLIKTEIGRKFIRWYYKNGPIMAKFILRHPFLKLPVRIVLYPVIFICFLIINGIFPYFVLFVSLCFCFKFRK
jgi:hypothetical protein